MGVGALDHSPAVSAPVAIPASLPTLSLAPSTTSRFHSPPISHFMPYAQVRKEFKRSVIGELDRPRTINSRYLLRACVR
jgi:hypothetical protein